MLMLKIILIVVAGAAVLAVVGLSAYVRLAPLPAEVVQADPEAAERTGKPNDHLIAPGGDRESFVSDVAPEEMFEQLEAAFLAQPRTERVEADMDDGRLTLVQRSRLMGYPDVISVRVSPDGAGSRVSVWSQSIYGQSDMGVNRARLQLWLADAGFDVGD